MHQEAGHRLGGIQNGQLSHLTPAFHIDASQRKALNKGFLVFRCHYQENGFPSPEARTGVVAHGIGKKIQVSVELDRMVPLTGVRQLLPPVPATLRLYYRRRGGAITAAHRPA